MPITVENLLLLFINHSNKAETIEPNERIAQVVITPFLSANFNQIDELSDTVRGVGGFGSTGK